MIGLVVCLLILLIPIYCQFKYGVKATSGWINLNLWQLTLICFISEFFIALLMFFILMFLDSSTDTLRCGLGLAGVTLFAFPISFFILLVGVFQMIVIKKDE